MKTLENRKKTYTLPHIQKIGSVNDRTKGKTVLVQDGPGQLKSQS